MADADIVIVILDASEPVIADEREILRSVEGLQNLTAFNKVDKLTESELDHALSDVPELPNVVPISAKTGLGIENLKRAIVDPFAGQDASSYSGFLITDARHHDLLVRAGAEIRSSLDHLDQKMSEEIVLVGLHNALRYLGEITGETTTEDMLTRIFSTFCIGK